MTKDFRRVKTGIIMAIFLVSIFAVFAPTSSAKIWKVTPIITITAERDQNIIPRSGVLEINISVSFTLSGLGADYVQSGSLIANSGLSIQLEVEEQYDWIDASINNANVEIKISDVGKPWTESSVTLTVTEKAPAFTQGKVKIIATSQSLSSVLFEIEKVEKTSEVSFEVGYWPVVTYEVPEGNFKEIGPLDTADFPIILTNLANGPTYIGIEVVKMPGDDWSVSVPSSVTLSDSSNEEGVDSVVHLSIKPPISFGFHNERESFQIRFTPQFYGSTQGRPELIGQSETIQFNVQTVGMSPGAGFEIPLIITILVILFVGIYLYRKKKK